MSRLVWAVLLMACTPVWEPQIVESYDPPPIYTNWWAEISKCAGLSGDFTRIRWFEVQADDPEYFPCPVGSCQGWWSANHDIFLARASVKTKWIVQHEMLHDLIGVGGHPPVFERCGVR